MSAADAVGHLDLRHIKVLRARAQGFACHCVLEEGGGGDIRRREPEGYVGALRFFLVGGLGLHLLLPLDELLQLLFIVCAELAADGFHQ